MEKYQEIERSIITTYRRKIWARFIKGIKEFKMVNEGDKIAVCISGGKDSMLLAKCMQELHRHNEVNFDLEFIVMNPGYNEVNKQKIIDNAKLLNIPINIRSKIIDVFRSSHYIYKVDVEIKLKDKVITRRVIGYRS